tara:strand:- start:1133 stop:1681 length:549 start_codon:yes stop_codon:yes gene_type:complete
MPTVIIRPDGDTTVGSFSNTPINAVLSDSNDATFTNNTAQNQSFIVSLDDVSLSGATFNSWTMTVRAKKGGKGNASCNARLFDSSFAVNHVSSLSITSSSYINHAAGTASFPSGFSESDVNNLSVRIDTTGGTQVFIAEIYVTIDYTAASGYGQNVNTVAAANIGKVNSVATANIGKVNSVD